MCTLKMLPWCRSNQLHTSRPCMSVNALEVRHLKSEARHQETRKRLVRPASSHTELNSVSDGEPSRYEMAGAFCSRRVFCSGRAFTKLPKMTRAVYRRFFLFLSMFFLSSLKRLTMSSIAHCKTGPPKFGNARSKLFTLDLQ